MIQQKMEAVFEELKEKTSGIHKDLHYLNCAPELAECGEVGIFHRKSGFWDAIDVYDWGKWAEIMCRKDVVYKVFNRENKKGIKEQFGSDYDRFVRQSYPEEAYQQLYPINEADPFCAELERRIKNGQIHMADKESCVVWKATNVVGFRWNKQGLLILHDR